jgi:hypothetical protein
MLRVNVGLSRKLSKDYNSTGYSINLEGEITAPVSDPQAVVEQVKELFDLAEETLDVQIERSQSVDAMAARDKEPATQNGRNGSSRNGSQGQPRQASNGNGREDVPATNKQIQFLLSLGQQQRLSKSQLQSRVTEILGYECDIYDLTKRNAGMVLDALSGGNGQRAAAIQARARCRAGLGCAERPTARLARAQRAYRVIGNEDLRDASFQTTSSVRSGRFAQSVDAAIAGCRPRCPGST